MLKVLFRKQLLEVTAFLRRSSKTGKTRSRTQTAAMAALFAVLLLFAAFCIFLMAWPMCTALVQQGLGWLYFASMALTSLIISVVASAFMSYSALFQAKDTELLLSLPIPPEMVFTVRAAGVYLTGLLYLLLAWVPAVVCYGLTAPRPLPGLLASVPMALSLALIAAVLAILLGWAAAAASARARHKSAVTVAASLMFLIGYFWIFQKIGTAMNALTSAPDGQSRFSTDLMYPIGRAAEGDLPALAGWLAAVLLAGAAAYRILSRRYLAALTDRRGTTKAAYELTEQRQNSLRRALLRRELQHLGASPSYMLNASLGTLTLPLLGLAALWKSSALHSMARNLPGGMIAMVVCGLVCTGASVNLLTAPSISLEGKNLWLMQSLPVTAWQVLRAKLELHLLLTALPAVFCAGCISSAMGGAVPEQLLSLAVIALFVLLMAESGLMMGLLMPDLHWTSEGAVIRRGLPSAAALLGGWSLSMVQSVGIYLLSSRLGAPTALLLCAAVLGAADLGLFHWLRTSGTAHFEELA